MSNKQSSNTDGEVDTVLSTASPKHPALPLDPNQNIELDLNIGPGDKRLLANEYNDIIRRHNSNRLVSFDDAATCTTVADARKLVSSHIVLTSGNE